MNLEYNNKPRYVELTKEIEYDYIWKESIETGKIIPVYLEVLYIPEFHLDPNFDFDNPLNNTTNIKRVLLKGYAYRKGYYIYVEYLNLEGYLETRVYCDEDYPKIYLRKL